MAESFGEQPRGPEEEFESVQHEKSLSEIDLDGLVDSLAEYNKKFNWGTILARDLISEKGISKKKVEAGKVDMLEELKQKHKEELGRTGLDLEPVKGLATVFTGKSNIETSEMRLNLVDGKKFINYLNSLGEGSLAETQSKGLVAVADSLTKQLTYQYDLGNSDDARMIELFGTLAQIIDGYRRLDERGESGVAKSVEKLEKYLSIARQKYLKEYLLAENGGLLDEVGGKNFGPSQWQGDSNPKSYRNYWEKALKKAVEIGKNKNAKDFQKQVIDNLKKSLVFAKKDIRSLFEGRLKQQEIDERNPDIVILNRLTADDVEKEIEEYRIIIDEMYERIEEM